MKGNGKEKGAGLRIPFFPSGFTVATVLSGNLDEVDDANGDIPTLKGQSWPEKTVFYFEVCVQLSSIWSMATCGGLRYFLFR